jgi:hypothetical protein
MTAATFSASYAAAQDKKPNILVIMGDDIGMWNIGAYHRGMMAGRTPNLDAIAKEGMLFTDYYAEAKRGFRTPAPCRPFARVGAGVRNPASKEPFASRHERPLNVCELPVQFVVFTLSL